WTKIAPPSLTPLVAPFVIVASWIDTLIAVPVNASLMLNSRLALLPLSVSDDLPVPLMIRLLVIAISPEVSVIVALPANAAPVKVIVSRAAVLLAAMIAARRLPAPVSAVVVTWMLAGTMRSSRFTRLRRRRGCLAKWRPERRWRRDDLAANSDRNIAVSPS